jgi:hypothetical protein
VRYGYTPDIVDSWPVVWAAGWLLERTMELEGDPERWKGQQIGFGLEDPDYDPAFDAPAEPPAGWESLPMHVREEVGDGE